MLKFQFLPSDDDDDIARAIILVGKEDENDGDANWYIPLEKWDRKQYVKNWLQAIDQLGNNGKGSFLVLAGEIEPEESIECFMAWKKGDSYIFQNDWLYQEEIDEPININETWKYMNDKPCSETEEIKITQEQVDSLRESFVDYLSTN